VSDLRVGLGVDAHGFDASVPLVLGGVEFSDEPGLSGHSDGDVVTHALIDALLGAANLGDIGAMFPSDDDELSGISSLLLLSRAYRRVQDAGYELVNASCVLIGERPKVADRRAEIVVSLAETLGVEPDRIAVSGTTTDRLGFTGRGEGLAAQAVALLRQRD
jgi:2-C-methyl-D-erythritol 2,4-cyclodiphosphate synthase